jgi:ABC-2 type transport system permease protein
VFELVSMSYASLTSPSLWIGVAVAAALIAVAIRLRRWREDA